MHDDLPKDDSSVWSSYSDLFTNVAIIFLVMFVFALVKSGVNRIEQVQTQRKHAKELEGKLSQKDLRLKDQRIDRIRQKVDEMKNYETVIDAKVAELNEYAKKMQENKEVLKEVIESQLHQDSLMKAAQERLESEKKSVQEKKVALEEAKVKIDLLNDDLSKVKLEVRQKEDTYNRQIEEATLAAARKEEELKNLLASQEAAAAEKVRALRNEIDAVKTETQMLMAKKENELGRKVETLTASLDATKAQAKQLEEDLRTTATARSIQENLVQKMKDELKGLENELAQNTEARERLNAEKKSLAEAVTKMNMQNDRLRQEFDALRKSAAGAEARQKNLLSQVQGLQSKLFESEAGADNWKRQYDQKLGEADKLWKDLAASQKRFSDLAKTMAALKDSVKNDVANRLIGKFKENNLNSQVNRETGEVILLSGEGFNFEKGSARLSKEAKALLKKIIPVYAAVLFADDKVLSQLDSINMEGHSSPSLGGKYVAPEDTNAKAYGLNMRLSAQRAASVAEFLMGEEIGDYPHKAIMKKHLQAVGMGYMRPIVKSASIVRAPASQPAAAAQDCGPYDCGRSQRVQINFLLKDNIEEIRKIIDSNGGIK